MPKPLAVWITTNCGKFWKRWEYRTSLPASWETFMQVKKQQLELDMEQQTGSELGKEYIKAVNCYSAYLTSMQSTSWETLDWKKHKLEWRLPEKYQEPQICRWYHSYGRKWRRTKEPLGKSERGEWKRWLKTQHSRNDDHGISGCHAKRKLTDFIFLVSKITADGDCSHQASHQDACSLEEKLLQT